MGLVNGDDGWYFNLDRIRRYKESANAGIEDRCEMVDMVGGVGY